VVAVAERQAALDEPAECGLAAAEARLSAGLEQAAVMKAPLALAAVLERPGQLAV